MSYWFLHHLISIESLAHVHFIFVLRMILYFLKKYPSTIVIRADNIQGQMYIRGSDGNLWKLSSSSFTLLSQRCAQSAEWESEWNRDAHYDCTAVNTA